MSRVITYGFLVICLVALAFGWFLFRQVIPQSENIYNPVTGQEEKIEENKEIEPSIYYLGYGSNMHTPTMNNRCGQDNFVDLGRASLPGYQFYFFRSGAANIKKDLNQQVEGVLYRINENCLKSLDRAEGYPTLYQRQEVEVDYGDKKINAEVYIIQEEDTTGLPSDRYYQIVLEGANSHNLPAEYVEYIKFIAGRLESP